MEKLKTVIFLHGFFASGSCVPALALKEALSDAARVLSPDLPLHPEEALDLVRSLCARTRADLIIGNSCGSFLAQMLAPSIGVPALLGNPHFMMTAFLRQRIGPHSYKSPRRDGRQDFVIDDGLVGEFALLEARQFDGCREDFREKVWGIFGERDTLARFEPLFLEHYSRSFRFPGGHTPTAGEVAKWHAPLARKMLETL